MYICTIMQSQGVDRIQRAVGLSFMHDIVEPMSEIAVKLVFHSPMSAGTKSIEDTCARFDIVCFMYIFRTIGIDTGERIEADGL